jgi:hypothetical protein
MKKGRGGFARFSAETHDSFWLIVVIQPRNSDQILTRCQTNQRVPKKYLFAEDANFSWTKSCMRAVRPCPFVSSSASTTCVPAEMRLNWVEITRDAAGDRGQSYWLPGRDSAAC